MPNQIALGPSKAHEEPDDLEDYEDSDEEEQGEDSSASQVAENFFSRLAKEFVAAQIPSLTAAPVTAPIVTGTAASAEPSTTATSNEESSSLASLSTASSHGKTVWDFGSSVSSLDSASGAQATRGSESKASVFATPAAENISKVSAPAVLSQGVASAPVVAPQESSSHPVTVSSCYTAQESSGSRVVSQAPPTIPSNPFFLTNDDMEIVMRDIDQDGDMWMPDIDPDVEMPDAPPLKRICSRGRSVPRRDTPLRRRYWGLPGAPVRRFGERTADRKNARRAYSKVLGKGKLFGCNLS